MTIGARDTGPMRRARTGLACAAALALSAGPAYAQQDGVFVDPDSPSGKEYAIPFESARRQADPRPVSPQSVSSGASRATLFGEGVISPSAARGARRGGETGSGKGSSGADARPDVLKIATSRPGAPDSGLETPVLVLGIGLLVLLVGAGAGFVVRRRAG